ncbi:MAG: hypothetical protein U0W24_09735 [Bacteroidales bacterium]
MGRKKTISDKNPEDELNLYESSFENDEIILKKMNQRKEENQALEKLLKNLQESRDKKSKCK